MRSMNYDIVYKYRFINQYFKPKTIILYYFGKFLMIESFIEILYMKFDFNSKYIFQIIILT